jgi:hypothetical protein
LGILEEKEPNKICASKLFSITSDITTTDNRFIRRYIKIILNIKLLELPVMGPRGNLQFIFCPRSVMWLMGLDFFIHKILTVHVNMCTRPDICVTADFRE